LYLRPVAVDIGETKTVPVLIPAARRTQTPDDKLTPLQLDILKAVGMEMFAESGIKSNQLDEILPAATKRASKYHSLNTLIRLGYIKPHVKGDPYHITEAGRQKLSEAEYSLTATMSNQSKTSPSMSIWTLPDSSPMSSPTPHTSGCGMDETSDQSVIQTIGLPDVKPANANRAAMDTDEPSPITRVTPDIIETFVRPGLVSADELYAGYQQARLVGRADEFREKLRARNDKAADLLDHLIAGKRSTATVLIPRLADGRVTMDM
jgi:hypothetical protein